MSEAPTRFSVPPGTPPLVSLKGIAKYFPGVIANQDVDLDIMPGEIHALLGENGAGKSTLMNILTGIYRADAGEIIVDGYQREFSTPLHAIAAGIGMVHQHFKLVQAFTVAENIHLGWSETPRMASAQVLEARTAELAKRFNLQTKPAARVSDLSTGEQQRVEILRVLARKAKILILDEPTAVLTPAEARELFKALRDFTSIGNSVIFISHKLDEVLEISDRISILRGGRKIATENTADCNPRMLAKLMVGRDIVLADMRHRSAQAAPMSKAPVLSLRNVAALGEGGTETLHDISLDLHAGEILGIAGVAGNGQRELSQLLTGMRPASRGQILIDGKPVDRGDAAAFAEIGIGHIPEDRLHSGLAPALSVTVNAVMREYRTPPVSRGGLYSPRAATTLAKEIAAAADVAIPDFGMPIRNLSGGNQQRLVARREMRIASKVLIAAYPSRGLDVGAINTMLRYIVELRDLGAGVILISEELEELLNLSDRIAVLYEGRIMGIIDNDQPNIDEIGLLMGGLARSPGDCVMAMAYRVQRLPSALPAVALAARATAIVLALVVAAVILAIAGANPLDLGYQVLEASFGSSFGMEDLGVLVTPLILTGLSVAVAQQIGAWNIGAEGQFYAGAFCSGAVGLFVPGPPVVILPLMFFAGLFGGAIWILVPTLARAYANVSELITTLLLNFVAILLVYYVSTDVWRDRTANSATPRLSAEIPELYGLIHWGLPIAVLAALLVAGFLAYSRWGYEVRLVGSNPDAGKYAGMKARRHLITVMLLSGALAGLAGMLEIAGTVHRLQGGISNNYGYLGIMVAVLARGSAVGVIFSAALMAFILNSGIILQTQGLTTSVVLAITGLILFLTAIGDELAHYRIVRDKV